MTTELRTTLMYNCYTKNAIIINTTNNKASTLFFRWYIMASITLHFLRYPAALITPQKSVLAGFLTIQLCGSFLIKTGTYMIYIIAAFCLPHECYEHAAAFRIKKCTTFKKSF